jgi:hypothetical protein
MPFRVGDVLVHRAHAWRWPQGECRDEPPMLFVVDCQCTNGASWRYSCRVVNAPGLPNSWPVVQFDDCELAYYPQQKEPAGESRS